MDQSTAKLFIGFGNKFDENKYIIDDKLNKYTDELNKSNEITLGYLINHDDILNDIFEPGMVMFITSVINGTINGTSYFTIETIDILKGVLNIIERIVGILDISIYLKNTVILNDNNIRIAPEFKNGRLENEKTN